MQTILDHSEQVASIQKLIEGATTIDRLAQLRHALTSSTARSHYAEMPASDRQALDRLAAQRIAELRKQYPPQPRPPREARPQAPAPQLQQLDLFEDTTRWPRKPYCTNDLEAGIQPRTLKHAITRPYIQINPPHLRIWSIFDVDRPGAALAWEDAGLPYPAWVAINRENAHAHLVWGLSAPVLVDSPDMRQAPLRYLAAVEAAFREKLQADQGYSGLITKNPAHPLWRVLRGPRLSYTLDEMAEWVDLPKHAPRRKPEEVGLGRNVTLFDWLRQYAYRHIRHYKGTERNFVLWQSHLNNKALERNGDFLYPLSGSEVWQIAKSVSKWTWNRFDLAASDARFSATQAARGRRRAEVGTSMSEAGFWGGVSSGKARLAASENKRASARLMRAQGYTQQQIADELGASQQSVSRWLAD